MGISIRIGIGQRRKVVAGSARGAWAATRCVNGPCCKGRGWRVTHIPTGLTFGDDILPCGDKDEMIAMAVRIGAEFEVTIDIDREVRRAMNKAKGMPDRPDETQIEHRCILEAAIARELAGEPLGWD